MNSNAQVEVAWSLRDALSASASDECPLPESLQDQLRVFNHDARTDVVSSSVFLPVESRKGHVLIIPTDHDNCEQAQDIGKLLDVFAASGHLRAVGTELCNSGLERLRTLNKGPPYDQLAGIQAADRHGIRVVACDRPFAQTSRRAARLVGNEVLLRAWKRTLAKPLCHPFALALCSYQMWQASRNRGQFLPKRCMDFIGNWAVPAPLLQQLVENNSSGSLTSGITSTAKQWEDAAARYAEVRRHVVYDRATDGCVWFGHGREQEKPGDLAEVEMAYLSGKEDPTHVQSILQRVAISERDAVLTEAFRDRLLQTECRSSSTTNLAVALVGRAHMVGIRRLWMEHVSAEDVMRLTGGTLAEERWWFPIFAAPFERLVARGFS